MVAISTALCRTDFMRLIGALKVSSPSPRATNRLARLKQIFEDFHCAIVVPKSNVKVYSAFLETLHFWRMDDQIPRWIQRIKSNIRIPQSTAPVEDEILLIRESPQEQYHDLMRALARVNQVDAMLKCLEELKADHSGQLHLTTKAYDTVLETYIKHKDTASAMRIFQEMQDQGISPQLTTFNILLQGHLENKDARATQHVLESLLLTDIRPDIYTFNLLMSGYLKLGDIELVNGFYKGLGEYGLVPNSKTYRILMKTHLRQGEVGKVVDLFCKLKDSPKAELNPGPEDYRVLIQALASHGRMPDALRVLREMTETAKVPVTTPIYNVVLNQYARDGQVEKARGILDRIISEKLPLIDGSINPLIRAYLAQKDLDKVEEMMQIMDRHGLQPSRTTYNIMINSTRNSGSLSGAMEIYDRMLSAGVDPDVWTYNTLLDLHVVGLSPAQNDVRRKGDPGKVSEEQLKEYLPRVESLLQDMKVRGIKPDVVTYGKLIHQYVILRDIDQAEMLFHEMLKSGISPNGYIFNTLMNGFTLIEEMDKALELFRRMPKHGVQPDATTFTTLIKGYANLEQMRLAQDFADSLQQQNLRIPMDQYCLNTLMQLAQRSNQPGMALDFFEMMRGRGIEPDKITFTILLNSLSREFEESRLMSSTAKMGDQNYSRRSAAGGDRSGVESKNVEANSATEAIETLLEVVQRDIYPLHYSEITTVLAAYFRLGRPLAAIEFFKTSLWREGSKLNTTNCGVLFHGLLAPEHKKRFDGIALNLYSRMLSGTKEAVQPQEEQERNAIEISDDDVSREASRKDQSRQNSSSNDGVSWALPQASSSRAVLRKLKVKPEDSLSSGLPILDLISISTLLQSFSNRQNWGIVLQIWQDLESVGAEKLYPFTMPPEFLGMAARAYHMTPDRERWSGSKKDEKKNHAEIAKKLLRRLWRADHRTGVEWSVKIYGYNIFEPLTTANMSSSSSFSLPPSLGAGAPTSPSNASTHSPSLLSSYLSENASQSSYQREARYNEGDKDEEGKDEEGKDEEGEDQQQHH
ncbi:hypothetical protein BGZ58_000874 [Dissophora ornata]|nr:hypothetical protein BGZ58_000874 [Dissophora ornata]